MSGVLNATQALHGMGRPFGLECAGKVGFDLIAHCLTAGIVVELYAYPRLTVALRALGGNPRHASGEGNLLGFIQQGK